MTWGAGGGQGGCRKGGAEAWNVVVVAGAVDGGTGIAHAVRLPCTLLADRPCIPAPEGAAHPLLDIGAGGFVSESGFTLAVAGGVFRSTTASGVISGTGDGLEDADTVLCRSGDPLCIAVPFCCEGGLLGVLSPSSSTSLVVQSIILLRRDALPVLPPPASSAGRPSFPQSSSPPLPSLSRSTISLVLDAFSRFRFAAEAKKAGSNDGESKDSSAFCDSGEKHEPGESGGGEVVLDATDAGVDVKIESGDELLDDGDSAADPRDRPDAAPRPAWLISNV